MIVPLLGEAEASVPGLGVEGADFKLHLALGNPAWVQVERALGGRSYLDVIGALISDEIAGRSPSLEITRAVLWGATRKHHPDLSPDDCGELIVQYGEHVLPALGEAMRGSVKFQENGTGEAKRAPAPAEKKSGTGMKR